MSEKKELNIEELEKVGGGTKPGQQFEIQGDSIFDLFEGSGTKPGTQCKDEGFPGLDIIGGSEDKNNQ